MHSTAPTFLYQSVASRISELIAAGSLRPGDRIPSVRRLKSELKVSASTVLQAYLLLEERGLVESRPQSGFYVALNCHKQLPEPVPCRPSLTAHRVSVCELVETVLEAAHLPGVIPLGVGELDARLLPARDLVAISRELLRKNPALGLNYEYPPGVELLRHQIARRSLSLREGFGADDIVITSGGMEAINLSLRALTKPGDTIAVESPTFYGILQAVEQWGLLAVEIPTDSRDGIQIEALEAAMERHALRALILTPNFSNPLGSLMPVENRKAVLRLASKHCIPIIEDDVYGELYFNRERLPTLKALDTSGLVHYCGSFSKSLAPGFRIGWSIPGARYRDEIKRLKFMTSIASNTFPQYVIGQYLKSARYDRHLRRLRTHLVHQIALVSAAVSRYFPEGTKISRPQGGFVLWVECPKEVNTTRLYQDALPLGINFVPGPVFSAKDRFHHCLRLNCGNPWSEPIEQAIAKLGGLVHEQLRRG